LWFSLSLSSCATAACLLPVLLRVTLCDGCISYGDGSFAGDGNTTVFDVILSAASLATETGVTADNVSHIVFLWQHTLWTMAQLWDRELS